MVDEVNISNVGGKDGVASEVTLVKLQAAIENLAGKKGLDPKAANKGLVDLKKSLGQNEKEIKQELEARGDSTDALEEHTDALGKASKGLLSFGGAIIGSGIDSIKGMSSALISGSNNLSDFSQHIPIVGGALSMLTGVMDNSVNTFQSMAKSGAAFDYNLGQMRSTAAQAGLSLEQFAGMISENSEKFAAFGGTVTQGARRTSQLVNSLGDQREQLMAMGLTFEDISEQMQFYQFVTRAGARTEQANRQQQAEAAASLSKNMLQLSKLTGEDVKAQQEKIAQAQMDVAFQRELAKMDADERNKINKAMADAQQAGGEVAVDALKAEVLGMPPLTERLQTYQATQAESAEIQRQAARDAMNTAVSADEFEQSRMKRMGDYLESQLAAGNDFDTILKAGAMGAEGIAGELSEQLGMSSDILMKYVDDTGQGLEFNREQFEKDFAGTLAQPDGSGELSGMAAFREGLRETRKSLTDNLLNPLMTLLAPAVRSMGETLDGFVESEGFTEFSATIKEKIEDFKVFFGEFIEKFKEDPQEALKELFENHIGPFFKEMTGKLVGLIGDGIKAGITSLFTSPVVLAAMTAGIAAMFARSKMAGGAGMAAGGAGGGKGRGLLKGAGRLLGRAAAPLAIGTGLVTAGSALANDELSASEKTEEVSGAAGGVAGGLAGAKAGAALGAFGGPLGIAAGGLIGGGLGYLAGSDIGSGLARMFTGNDSDEEPAERSQMQDVAAARQAASVSDEQMQRLEKLVGFAPQVNTLSQNIVGFNDQFNNMQLSYQEIDRATLSLEKMAEQLEEINNQLDGDKSFLEKINPFSSSDDQTASDALAQSGSGSSDQMEQLNRTMNNILAVLMASNDMNKKQLGAARAMSGDLYQGF